MVTTIITQIITQFIAQMHAFPQPFNPEFTIVTFIHYKPRIAAAILDL